MNTVHKITNGAGEVKGWAVVVNGAELIGEFATIEKACEFADAKPDMSLTALKTLPAYNHAAVQIVMADTGFATEQEAAIALWSNDWDLDKAVDALLFG